MIGFLTGHVVKKTIEQTKSGIYRTIICTKSGVGYVVYLDQKVMDSWERKETFKITESMDVSLCILTDVRENAIDLYGFEEINSLITFRKLISVKGVGPKTALLITGKFTPTEIESAFENKNAKFFEAVPGIGKKTAESVIEKLGKKNGKKKKS